MSKTKQTVEDVPAMNPEMLSTMSPDTLTDTGAVQDYAVLTMIVSNIIYNRGFGHSVDTCESVASEIIVELRSLGVV